MQLKPRYGDDPVLRIESTVGDVRVPMLRQQARFVALLRELDDTQWSAPTRCEQWSVQDVVAHLTSANQFWALSITSGLAGTPTQFLAQFDPVATPEQMVAAVRTSSPTDVLDGFVASTDALGAALADVAALDGGWNVLAEAPPGHIALRGLALHALWDAWVHERDVMLPLGLIPDEEPDEIVASLHYAAALGPAFLATNGSTRRGALAFDVTGPATMFVVDVGPNIVVRDGAAPTDAVAVTGSAVAVLEALSCRAPLDAQLPADAQWMLGGLAEVFDLVG